MNCTQVRERLPEYLTHSPANREAEALRLHLDRCAACREEWEFDKLLADTLKRPLRVTPPSDFAARLLARLQFREHPKSRSSLWAFLPTLPYGMAAAVAILLGILASPELVRGTAANLAERLSNPLFSLLSQGMTLLISYWGSFVEGVALGVGLMADPELSLPLLLFIFTLPILSSLYFSFGASSS